ncbi:enoyl-CoA hydratase/isomerase family protein [Oceanibacterium hippocampi]|uniref:Putative enoyl-CoA hydratase echA8 n=1 Tax=Oceanibacterium hippocampi TaxID=745714 RepID=A0A1Y5RB95_9PROT|nr:enoyl-CoA hydratase/isomerase family protein [Oceanibacterium hippocampi]SLN12635.1 putative enoyl-CoA hydratase echA8 [Oceanibacterium hippocampi]
MPAYETIRLEIADGIATLTLDRPKAKNALDLVMRGELRDAVDRLDTDTDIRAIVFTGAGGDFCSGGDLKSMQDKRSANDGRRRLRGGIDWIVRFMTIDKPVIAAVDGVAYGAGFNLALMADFVLATPRARFCQSFGRVGLVPDFAGFYSLPRIVGMQKAKELIFSAREIGAEEAKDLGLVYDIVPAEDLAEAARALAGRFLHASPVAIGVAKGILNQSFSSDLRQILEMEASGQGICMESEAHREAVRRFVAKEPARFVWPKATGG